MNAPKLPPAGTCRSAVRVHELPTPLQALMQIAVAEAVEMSGAEVDRSFSPYKAEVCTAPDGATTYRFYHMTMVDHWFTPNSQTHYNQTLRCDKDGYCKSSMVKVRLCEESFWRPTGDYEQSGPERSYTIYFNLLWDR